LPLLLQLQLQLLLPVLFYQAHVWKKFEHVGCSCNCCCLFSSTPTQNLVILSGVAHSFIVSSAVEGPRYTPSHHYLQNLSADNLSLPLPLLVTHDSLLTNNTTPTRKEDS